MTGEGPGPERRHVQDPQPLEGQRRETRRSEEWPRRLRRRRRLLYRNSPRRGAASGARRLPDPRRKGGPGFVAPSLGLATKVPRSRKCAHVAAFAPFVMGALGIRNAEASSSTSSTVRSRDPGVDGGCQGGAIEKERLVLHPLGVPHQHAEVQPLLSRSAPEPDEPVARRPDAGRRHEPLPAHRPAQLVVEGHRVVGEAHRQRLEHGDVDELTARRGTSTGGQRSDGAVEAGEPLPDLAADEDGGPFRLPPRQSDDPAGPGLQRELGGRLVAPGTVEPERRDRRDDQVRVGAQHRTRVQRRLLRQRRALRPDDGVGRIQQSVQRVETAGVRAVDHDAALGGAEEVEERAVVVGGDRRPRGRPASQRIALGRLDLDDLGAAVGQQLRAVGAADPGREVDDPEPRERWRHGPAGRSRPPLLRCGHVQSAAGRRRPERLSRHSGGN